VSGYFTWRKTAEADSLGLPLYEVVDSLGQVEMTFDGYFAQQDAQRLADSLNEQQAAMAAGEEI
jgi:hypothetical protein